MRYGTEQSSPNFWNTTPALLLAVSIPWRAASAADTKTTGWPSTTHTHCVLAPAPAGSASATVKAPVAIIPLINRYMWLLLCLDSTR